jgi:filamentous hemagglutinin family protein
MFYQKLFQIKKFGLISSVFLIWMLALPRSAALEPISPDDTLGNEPSQLTTTVDRLLIQGGAIRGSNLFHSFREFNVQEGQQVYFTNPSGVENILTRVTGDRNSNILGTLGVNGTANLFLLNPNGIVFRENAQLDVRGSFLASTANSLRFDNWQFSAASPQPVPRLNINVPIGLQFGRAPRDIVNNSGMRGERLTGGLRVQPGNTLALVGGNVTLDGGVLIAPGGRVELGGVREPGMVGLDTNGNQLRLSLPDEIAHANVSITNESVVGLAGADGGDIVINAHNLNIGGASCLFTGATNCIGSLFNNRGGNLIFNATGAVEMENVLEVSTARGGEITIQAASLLLNNALLTTETITAQDAGNITIQARDFVEVTNQNGTISATSVGAGDGGNISIETAALTIRNGGGILTEAQSFGNAGNLIVRATDSVEVIGHNSELSARTQARSTGNAGNLTIDTRGLVVRNGGVITTTTRGDGQGGELNVTADIVQLIGVDDGARSSLNSGTGPNGIGNAGSVTITTGQLIIQDGALVQARTSGDGQGGVLEVRASESIELVGTSNNGLPSSLNAETTGSGSAGDIRIITEGLIVRNGAVVRVSGEEDGVAGNMSITASSIQLDNGRLVGETSAGEGANLTIRAEDSLLMQDQSLISAEASNGANGGNVLITANTITAEAGENNDIVASAVEGQGGNIFIIAREIVGLAEGEHLPENRTNDIDASSQFGESGTVVITLPVSTEPPPSIPVAAEPVQGCQTASGQATTRFFNIGRGGLPPNPYEPLSNSDILDDVRLPVQETTSLVDGNSLESLDVIEEAKGWMVNESGEVVLVAEIPALTQGHCRLE